MDNLINDCVAGIATLVICGLWGAFVFWRIDKCHRDIAHKYKV